jgi:hypothetical protein
MVDNPQERWYNWHTIPENTDSIYATKTVDSSPNYKGGRTTMAMTVMPDHYMSDDDTILQLAELDQIVEDMSDAQEINGKVGVITAIYRNVDTHEARVYQCFYGHPREEDNGWLLFLFKKIEEDKLNVFVSELEKLYDGDEWVILSNQWLPDKSDLAQ